MMPRRLARITGGMVAAAAAAWTARHVTSAAVRGWSPPAGDRRTAGSLSVRTAGHGDRTWVLLHGLASSADSWGSAYSALAENGRVVAPDLLGFGHSMQVGRREFRLEDHLDALDAMADDLGIADGSLTVVGHSMGAVLALHWAARRSGVEQVVAFCAPLYVDAAEADRHIKSMGWLEGLFALESPLAYRTCMFMCEHRRLAAWVSVAISPQWPVRMARQGVLHTWEAYLGGLNGIIRNRAWQNAVTTLDDKGTPVLLIDGADDPVPVPGRAERLAEEHSVVQVVRHPSAAHDLPVAYPDWCLSLLRGQP